MTIEVLVIAAVRIAGSLPVLRWPLAGGILAILVDLSDLLLMNVLDLGGEGPERQCRRRATPSAAATIDAEISSGDQPRSMRRCA